MPFPIRAACIGLLAALPAALPAYAQEPQATSAEANVLPRVIDMLCVNLLRDAPGCEMAILLQSDSLDQMADLVIRTIDGTTLIVARDFVFSGEFEAQSPSLEAADNGALYVHSEQFAVGRTPWTETLTIAEADGILQVVGFDYSMLDRPAGGDFGCSVNLRTGAWRASALRVNPETGEDTQAWDETGEGAPNMTPILYWGGREPPAHCDAIMGEWFQAAP